MRLCDCDTCGEHSFFGQSLVVYDGELGQFDVLHPSDGTSVASSLPVELNVVSGVSILGGRGTQQVTLQLKQSPT